MTGARTLTRENRPSVPRSHTFTSENLPPLLSPSPTHVHQWVEGELRDGEQLVARHVALATAIEGTEAAVQCCDLLLRNCRHTSRQAGRQAGRQASQQARKLELWEMRSMAAATDSRVKGSRLALTRETLSPAKSPNKMHAATHISRPHAAARLRCHIASAATARCPYCRANCDDLGTAAYDRQGISDNDHSDGTTTQRKACTENRRPSFGGKRRLAVKD